MPESLRRSSDVPDFDTYPAEPPRQEKHIRRDGESALEQRARQVGTALGKAVATVRRTQEALKDVVAETTEVAASEVDALKNKAHQTSARVSGLTDTVKAKAEDWTAAAVSRAEELRLAAEEKTSALGSRIKAEYYRTRIRANQLVRDHPLHVVLAAGALGFLLGAGMRIWRTNRGA